MNNPGRRAFTETLTILEKKGYRLYPSARSELKKWMGRAYRAHLVSSESHVRLATVTIVSAAKTARGTRSRHVSAQDLKIGWSKLAACPGNLPPHRCMQRSIIDREDQMRAQFPEIEDIEIALKANR